MKFSEKEKESINRLNPISRIVFQAIINGVNDLLNGDCEDIDLCKALSSICPNKHGYFKPNEYVTVDGACKMLDCGRNRFYNYYVKEYSLCNCKFNTVPIGYKISEINRIINLENKK